jgi:hypothetical protein
MERLSQYGKPGKKEKTAPPAAKSRKDKRGAEANEPAPPAEQGGSADNVPQAA